MAALTHELLSQLCVY